MGRLTTLLYHRDAQRGEDSGPRRGAVLCWIV